jgi:hypothetical protein
VGFELETEDVGEQNLTTVLHAAEGNREQKHGTHLERLDAAPSVARSMPLPGACQRGSRRITQKPGRQAASVMWTMVSNPKRS